MLASKENARTHLTTVQELIEHPEQSFAASWLPDLKEFLEACEKKLPSKATYEKERLRKRKYQKRFNSTS